MTTLAELRTMERDRDWPSERLPADAEGFLRELGGPTLLHVSGADASRCRVISTLLHGNEPSGIRAVHRWLQAGEQPAVDLWIFIGAIDTALTPPGFAHRSLPGRIDLNRCWLPPFEGEEGALAREVLDRLRELAPEALVDIHNNTGHNPPYGVGSSDSPAELNIVGMFGERFVYSHLRLGTLVEAGLEICPSVTVECGRAGDPKADDIAHRGLCRFVGRETLELGRVEVPHMQVLERPVRVCVAANTRLAFGEVPDAEADLTVVSDIDRHNFELLDPGVRIGWLGSRGAWPVEALDEDGRDLSREFFCVKGPMLQTKTSLMPIMMTTHPRNALLDCLFYVVKPGPDRGTRAEDRKAS
jgi:hypothetical protein